MQVVQHVPAIYIGFHHLRIALQRARIVIHRLTQQLALLVDVSFEQWEVTLLGKQNFIFTRQGEYIVIAAEVIECISQVNRGVSVQGQFGEHFVSELGGLEIFAGQKEVPFRLAHRRARAVGRASTASRTRLHRRSGS